MTGRPSEFELIAQIFAPLATAPGALGLTDDAALLQACTGYDHIVTTDALVEGVHFRTDDAPGLVAKKALRVNLSDLAAKGAAPAGYLLALSLPPRIDLEWIEAFAHGLGEDQSAFGISLLGGDTTSTPGPLTLAITALGTIPTGTMIRRAGAKPGDGVYVSGTIGDAGGGLAILNGEDPQISGSGRKHLIERCWLPTPRLSLGQALRGVASAALDVSDGLIADLSHIADVSVVRVEIEGERIPRSPALHALWGDSVEAILRAATSGDDYEIAFTAGAEAEVAQAARDTGVAITRIGRVVEGSGVSLRNLDGHDISVRFGGYRHF
jgi:thiamine-monophosphate kinase